MMKIPSFSFSQRNAIFIACLLSVVSYSTLGQGQQTLKDAFKNGFLIGAALNHSQYTEQNQLTSSLVKTQFNSITAENDLKWERVHPKENEYNFEPADKFVEFGVKNTMVVIGHTLVWHAQTPEWVFKDKDGKQASKELLLQRMHDHISTVVGRYKGKIQGWDVVNEALEEDGSLRKSPWMEIIGEEYIQKAFQFAHEADPDAELYYNDFSIENAPKRAGAVKLITMLQAKGVKVAAVGMQGHYLMDWPTAGLLDSAINDFAPLGVKVMITELDVDILPRPDSYVGAEVSRKVEYQAKYNPYTKELPEEKQKELAKRYSELFEVLWKNKEKISRVTFWGVTDKESWLNYWPVAGRTSYPLLFNRDGKPKLAFNAVLGVVN